MPKDNIPCLLLQDLPFRKRMAYEGEREFRLIYESTMEERNSIDIPISLSCIERITFGPEWKENTKESVRIDLKLMLGCSSIHICQTTITNSTRWKRFGESAV